ncbi:MAG TPA: hypothetical protein VH477_00335 [Bryobacteraceae bacterium]
MRILVCWIALVVAAAGEHPHWFEGTKKTAIDGTKSWGFATAAKVEYGTSFLVLTVLCSTKEPPSVTFASFRAMDGSASPGWLTSGNLRYRLDDGALERASGELAQSRLIVLPKSPAFLARLQKAKTLAAEVQTVDFGTVFAHFDLTGLSEEYANTCGTLRK